MNCTATTIEGLENVLANEISELGGQEVNVGIKNVHFKTDLEGLYRINYRVRTALSILVPIVTDRIKNENQLHGLAIRIPWDKYLSVERTYAIRASVNESDSFEESHLAATKLSDSISAYFQHQYGSKPKMDNDYPDLRLNLDIEKERITISLNSSGSPLYERGYRRHIGDSRPLSPVMAAGLIKLSEWDEKSTLVDPMCGTGTIAIEANMMMCNVPAGYNRLRYGFYDFYDYDKVLWKKVREEENEKMIEPSAKIFAFDIDQDMIDYTKKNKEKVPHSDNIIAKVQEIFKSNLEPGLMILDAPDEAKTGGLTRYEFYEKLGRYLRRKNPELSPWVFSGDLEALKKMGYKATKRFNLLNGKIPSKFYKFENNDENS